MPSLPSPNSFITSKSSSLTLYWQMLMLILSLKDLQDSVEMVSLSDFPSSVDLHNLLPFSSLASSLSCTNSTFYFS